MFNTLSGEKLEVISQSWILEGLGELLSPVVGSIKDSFLIVIHHIHLYTTQKCWNPLCEWLLHSSKAFPFSFQWTSWKKILKLWMEQSYNVVLTYWSTTVLFYVRMEKQTNTHRAHSCKMPYFKFSGYLEHRKLWRTNLTQNDISGIQ